MQKRLRKGVAPFELCWQGYGFNTHKYQGGNSGKTKNKMEEQASGERINTATLLQVLGRSSDRFAATKGVRQGSPVHIL